MHCGGLFLGDVFFGASYGEHGDYETKVKPLFWALPRDIINSYSYNVIEPTACGLCWEVGNFIQNCHLQMGHIGF